MWTEIWIDVCRVRGNKNCASESAIAVCCLIELHPSHVISMTKFILIWSMEWLHRNNEYLYVIEMKIVASFMVQFPCLCFNETSLWFVLYRFNPDFVSTVKLFGFSLQRNMSFSKLIINQSKWIMYLGGGGGYCAVSLPSVSVIKEIMPSSRLNIDHCYTIIWIMSPLKMHCCTH